jgi:hypothetical protein
MQTHMTSPHMVMSTLHICAKKHMQAPARVAAHTRPWRIYAHAPIYPIPRGIYVHMSIPMRTHICIRMYIYIYIYICARASARPGATHTLTHTHLRARMHRHALTRIGKRRTHAGHDASAVYPANPECIYVYGTHLRIHLGVGACVVVDMYRDS